MHHDGEVHFGQPECKMCDPRGHPSSAPPVDSIMLRIHVSNDDTDGSTPREMDIKENSERRDSSTVRPLRCAERCFHNMRTTHPSHSITANDSDP